MKIKDEWVLFAARAAYGDEWNLVKGSFPEARVRAALEAVAPLIRAEALEGKVKDLEWRFSGGLGTHGAHIADCIYRYLIYPEPAIPAFRLFRGTKNLSTYATMQAAKAAAQRDVVRLVSSALKEGE